MGSLSAVSGAYLWGEYVKRVTPGKTQSEIAALAGIDQTGVSRWLNGLSTPRVDSVIRFARNLNRPPLEALVAAGYITREEAGIPPGLQISVRELPTDELLAEIRRRVSDR
ncbi:MAG: helix-turn-helix transcriptional regulator [Mycobacterium sp.]|nr:helix-turn-helix transcriptional regulator [Mycobacterium sp.]